jgi:hypothetical protein
MIDLQKNKETIFGFLIFYAKFMPIYQCYKVDDSFKGCPFTLSSLVFLILATKF